MGLMVERSEVVDASYHLREKSVVEVGVVGDLVDLFKGFGEAICFSRGVFLIALFRTRWWTVVVFYPVRVWN
jgi:hypothetical protein